MTSWRSADELGSPAFSRCDRSPIPFRAKRSHAVAFQRLRWTCPLPPYSPELNPVERIWHYLRSHWLANSVFISLADIMDACEMAWMLFGTEAGPCHDVT